MSAFSVQLVIPFPYQIISISENCISLTFLREIRQMMLLIMHGFVWIHTDADPGFIQAELY